MTKATTIIAPRTTHPTMSACASEISTLLTPSSASGKGSSEGDGDGSIALENDVETEVPSQGEFAQDVIDTFHLALPIFISRVSYVGVSLSIGS
jgi:hypothetical protein